MAHTYEQVTGTNVERTAHKLEQGRKRKRDLAIAAVVAGFFALLATAYFSYRGVAAPENPANARPNLVEPYQ
jgi:hypothetical protein